MDKVRQKAKGEGQKGKAQFRSKCVVGETLVVSLLGGHP